MLDCTGPTWDTVPVIAPPTPSTATLAEYPTLTEATCELDRVPDTWNDWVPMITMTLVLEPALIVSPTLKPTEAMVPLMGLLNWASLRDCWASIRFATAESIAA